jgi:hypothetical protein
LTVVCLQAALLFSNLNLLPIWSDELFTVNTAKLTISGLLSALHEDIHPPLYFLLLHALPWSSLVSFRAVSAVWALIATFLLDLFWTYRWRPAARWTALLLFGLSPAWILYSRMARSYSMQTALTLAAVYFLWQWIESRRGPARALIASVLLLYTHYVPGIAVLGAFGVVALRPLGGQKVLSFMTAAAAAYSPWLWTLVHALVRWQQASDFSSRYSISGNPLTEQLIKIAYGAISLTIGESFFIVSVLLVPVVLWMAWRGARSVSPRGSGFIAIATVLGYLAVARWVSYPFIPARLLWLLPFLTMATALGLSHSKMRKALLITLLISSATSILFYFRRENYIDKGYAAPLREIADRLNGNSSPRDIILVDAYNTDGRSLEYYLNGRTSVIELSPETEPEAKRKMAAANTVWIVHNQRDISPGSITTKTENRACSERKRQIFLYQPFEAWQKTILERVMTNAPSHYYQVTVCGPF